MKQLILIKQSPTIQLGHLYEHIFCMYIDILLRKHRLVPRLDYALDGTMYYGGIVYIEVELYTDAAIALSDALRTLTIKFDEDIITTAATQILAEKEEPLGSTGYDHVKRALEDLHAQPWQNIDDVGIIDTKNIRKKTGSFYIAEGKPLPARKLVIGVFLKAEFAKSHRELLPLFRQLAGLINASLQHKIASSYGYYSFDDMYKNTNSTIGVLNTFKVGNANDIEVDLADILGVCFDVIRDLRQCDAFGRYINELRNVSYYNHPGLAPNLEKNYENTHIFIGAKGWQKIATNENSELLLKYAYIEVKFGGDKLVQSL